MEEILHHLFSIKPYEKWDMIHIRCRIPSINSTTYLTVMIQPPPPGPTGRAYLSTQASGHRRLARQAELNEEVE